MTSALIKRLYDDDDVLCGDTFPTTKLRLLRLNLGNNKLASLPDDYWDFISQINGLYSNGAQLYAFEPESNAFKDVIAVNHLTESPDIAFLAENDLDILIYDIENEEFQVLDKSDLALWKHCKDFQSALAYLLKL